MKKTKSVKSAAETISSAIIVSTPSSIEKVVAPPPTRREIIEALAVKLLEKTRAERINLGKRVELLDREVETLEKEDALAAFKSVTSEMLEKTIFNLNTRALDARSKIPVCTSCYSDEGHVPFIGVFIPMSSKREKVTQTRDELRERHRLTNWCVTEIDRTGGALAHAKRLIEAKMNSTVTSDRVSRILKNEETNKALDSLLEKLTSAQDVSDGRDVKEVEVS